MAAAIPVVLALASTAATVYSTYESRQAEKKAEHQIERQEARKAEETRKAAVQRASDEEKRHRRILATQRAKYAAAGVEMEGTPLLVQMESLKESEEQLRRIREGGEVEAMSAEELAKAARERARQAQISGYVEAAGAGAGGLYTTGRTRDWW